MGEEKQVLNMIFRNSIGKTVTLSIEDPRDDVTEAEIKEAMEMIVEKNIFKKNNYALVEAVEAKVVTTNTESYDLVI